MLDPMSLEGMFAQYGRSLLWAITAAVGFGLGVGSDFVFWCRL